MDVPVESKQLHFERVKEVSMYVRSVHVGKKCLCTWKEAYVPGLQRLEVALEDLCLIFVLKNLCRSQSTPGGTEVLPSKSSRTISSNKNSTV